MSSITTVATEMNNDFDLLNSNKLSMNKFLK